MPHTTIHVSHIGGTQKSVAAQKQFDHEVEAKNGLFVVR